MFLDTLAIAYRIHLRHHYVRRYAALQRQRTDAAAREVPLEADQILPPVSAIDLTEAGDRRSGDRRSDTEDRRQAGREQAQTSGHS